MPYKNARDVVMRILMFGRTNGHPITYHRLQKFLFLTAHFYETQTGDRLFKEEFVKTRYGYILPSVRDSHGHRGNNELFPMYTSYVSYYLDNLIDGVMEEYGAMENPVLTQEVGKVMRERERIN